MSEINQEKKKLPWWRYVLWGMPIGGIAVAFAAGIIFWGGFNTAMEATNTMKFCTSCHEMRDFVFEEYKGTIHDVNRSGVGATCSDCHVPKDWTYKVIRKVQATKELWGKMVGTIATKEKFEAKRLDLAMNEWERMKASDSRECRNCHDFESMMPEFQKPRARAQHLNAMVNGQTCIDCHKGIAHSNLRPRADEDYLEKLESPNPHFVRVVPEEYKTSLARIEKIEADAAIAKKAKEKAQREAVQAQIAAAVSAAKVEARAETANTAQAASDDPASSSQATQGEVAPNINWSNVAPTDLTLFYPGQASFEWVQNGRSHGGARPLTKGGDACTTCHAKELETIGNKIVAGGDLEPTPIPGKRGTINATVQAAHDDQNLYVRLQWDDAGHNPAPFVEGGKMDPDNPIKVAMMIAGNDIELGPTAGCWVTCHADNSFMPFDPGSDAISQNADVAGRLEAADTITKYLSESRTKIEIKGRRGKAQGGWDKLKSPDEVNQLLADGSFMDLLRVYADGSSSNGYLLDRRINNEGEISAQASLSNGLWTVIFSRPLKSDTAGDVALEEGKNYTVGFAIHEDFAAARFHHVTLDTSLALDDAAAQINVVKQ